ncbi:MAG: translation initiation factor IF-3 [Verrucomicrobiales bacterium]|nr:translation initiation factor IF-3 [Verrucomicrobiales bacterium]
MNAGFGVKKRTGGNNARRRPSRFSDRDRINERIRAPRVRVVLGETNHQLGVMQTHEAIKLAKSKGLDLVEVAAQADPPVCRIVDYGKYKYHQEKQKKENSKQHKVSKLKELKFRIGIDPHDYGIKIAHAEDFLAEGHKLRIQLQFRGRQMAHQELGHELAKKIALDLDTMGHLDFPARLAGRNINLQVSPLPEKQRTRKIRTHLKGVTEEDDAHHSSNRTDIHEDRHDEPDEDEGGED